MSFATDSSCPSSEINVTPLIDVLLVLLVIFMVIVPVVPHGLESSVPQDQAAPLLPQSPVQLRLSVGDSVVPVRYSIGAQELTYAEVQPRLRALLATQQDRTLLVAADHNLSFQPVAAMVGEGRRAGAGAVMLQRLQP